MNMRQGGPGGRRPRGRHGGGGGGNGGPRPPRTAASLRHQTFDSNGPEVRVRGNAWQVYEKYLSLARDAQGSGDRVLAENLLQHAEHYYRITEAINDVTATEQKQRTQAFDQQPDMPANYFSPEGKLVGTQGLPAAADSPKDEDASAEVVRKTPPKQADPFMATDDEGEDSGPQKLVAGN